MKNLLIALFLAPLLALLALCLTCSLWLTKNGDLPDADPYFDLDIYP